MKKTIIKAADYELYRILLPWKYLFSRRKNYIVTELEKMHPRFSGNCCYDTKYSVQKKNLMAEVVVMEKQSLAEYKTLGGELFLESPRKRTVFSHRTEILRACSLVLIVLAGLLSFQIAKSFLQPGKTAVEIECPLENTTKNEDASPADVMSEGKNELCGAEKIISDVLRSVSSHGGKLSAFSYKSSENSKLAGGMCTFSVYGCNCEDVANARYSVVSFKNNEPHFEMVIPFSEEKKSVRICERLPLEQEITHVASIRKQLRNLGAVFESEKNGDETAEFSFFSRQEILYSCLKICANESEEALWKTDMLLISQNGGMSKVKIVFRKNALSEDEESFNPLFLTAQYAYLFGEKLKIEPKKTVLFEPAKNKIGEIKKKDGSVFVCYRNPDGKMLFEKKEAVNAGL